MTPTPTSTELRARIARREVLLWLGAFGWPLLRVLALGAVVGVACSLLLTEALGRMLADATSSEVALLGLRWGLALALAPALWAGLSSLALKLARGWALVPAFVLPAYVFAAAWLRSTELSATADALRRALSTRVDAMSSDVTQGVVGAMLEPSPTAAIPAALAAAPDAVFDTPVRVALDALESQVAITLAIALVPGTAVSLLALAIGYRRGWATRHEAELERLRDAR